ncbi:transcription antitermination factor NusB [Pelistega suis]|uniref:transcription antitermination factor NusB n=1 Tax=Pelistega suis TaxID=1631957 RepID=UPI00211D088A|nr:transcription antitermination factor NusB [Pelistega suis]MCQ9329770.1 transcription antitermination factor NusB [Pelistega suis]
MSINSRSARRRARELALQGIYAWIISGCVHQERGAIDAHLRGQEEFALADEAWYQKILYGVFDGAEGLREKFSPFVDRPVDELSPVEHGVLLLATFELSELKEVPYKVVINEAVELTKEFGGTDGFKFVNGVLDKLALTLRAAEVKKA